MPSPESYPIIQELESIEAIKQGFDMALEEGVKSDNFENTQILQHQLEIRRDALRDRLKSL